MIGAVVAALLQASAAWQAEIVHDGWVWIGAASDNSTVYFIKPGVDGPHSPYHRIWVRMEDDGSDGHALSTLSLVEIDCVEGRHRDIQYTGYASRNLTGQARNLGASMSWHYAGPGTAAEDILEAVCKT